MPSQQLNKLAPLWHTVVVLVLIGGWGLMSKLGADRARDVGNPHRAANYVLTIVLEWALFGVVILKAPVSAVVRERWGSARDFFRDLFAAALFWVGSIILLAMFARILGVSTLTKDLGFVLPQTPFEIVLWVAVSISAGICEETVFRGYLQPQLGALVRNVHVGVVLSAAVFGAAHAYQGFRRTVLIFLYGLMFGVFVEMRKSVRPGMIAHAWQDSVSGIVAGIALRRGLLP
jgi:membrane protease YdiL (CAAX protease family)